MHEPGIWTVKCGYGNWVIAEHPNGDVAAFHIPLFRSKQKMLPEKL